MSKIYLVRHCESEGNACRRARSATDPIITVKGYRQCEALRERFRNVKLDGVYTSDSTRAYVTCNKIAEDHNLKVRCRILLRETNCGLWEDQPWGNIFRDWPIDGPRFRSQTYKVVDPANSPMEQLATRMIHALRKIAKEVGPDGSALVVSHSVAIKSAMSIIKKMSWEEGCRTFKLLNTGITLLDIDETGNIKVEYENECSHLTGDLIGGNAFRSDYKTLELGAIDWEKGKDEYLDILAQDCRFRGVPFDREQAIRKAEEILGKDGEFIGVGVYKNSIKGFVLMETYSRLDSETAAIRIIMCDEFRNEGYAVQLFGHAADVLRHKDYTKLAMPVECNEDEKAVEDTFIFREDENCSDYVTVDLYNSCDFYRILA